MTRIVPAIAILLAMFPASLSAETRVPATNAEVQLSFAPVVERAAPAVVNIYATQVVAERVSPFFDDPFFSQFFRDFGTVRPREKNSLGSGVIVGDGLVVSNFHVVENATEIRVVLADRREFDGALVLADERADLAVIRLEGGEDLPALDFADSDALAVGDLVLAIGNPFGVGQTVSSGIVSGLARSGRGGGAFNAASYFIQTDAPINPGNSGGALVDMSGRLVGINTQIVTRSGGSNGIGFAIPANLVARVVAQAAAGEASFIRPWAGLEVQPIDADMANALGLDRPQGVLVRALADGSPFAEAGVAPGDVILAMDGQPVNAPAELVFRLSLQEMGSMVPVTLRTGTEEHIVAVEMRAATSAGDGLGQGAVSFTAAGPFQGLVLQDLTPDLSARLGLRSSTGGGVVVMGIDNPRSARNFQPGDIITEVNGVEIHGLAELTELASEDRRTWKLVIERRGGRVYLTWRG
ncbi:trypsin-like peptidase domain-containing protein [Sinisalibacter aestuarii]|uniref:Serine protease n=1 Tax=Sinisalibacter aestuarii TaxID=2949426 RepID=A0ABQ5LV06_9RHOB|nr:trypsin-like peptidase domain-containing protein [Sinisalibacter aestuarii]GKY88820.1 serine protease [Sinisalibacter aestuarii]